MKLFQQTQFQLGTPMAQLLAIGMLKRVLSAFAASLPTIALAATLHVDPAACARLLTAPAAQENQTHSLRVLTYNMEFLHLRTPQTKRLSSHFKDMSDVREEADIILETAPDILVLEEIHSLDSLQYFNDIYLRGNYEPYLMAGNDDGNFHIGFLVRKGLGYAVEARSHRDHTWIDPVDGEIKKLFTRDVPTLIFRSREGTRPQFILLGNHAKAPKDRYGDPESIMLRTAQYAGVVNILQNLKAEFGADVPLILAGDFNAPIHEAPETRTLLSLMTDSFDLLPRPPPESERITHTYHPKGKGLPTEYHQFDGILVSPEAGIAVTRAHVYRYKDIHGHRLGIPQTQSQRNQQPSDHFPVYADLQIPAR